LYGGNNNLEVSFVNCYSTGEIINEYSNGGGFLADIGTVKEVVFTNCYWTSESGAEFSIHTPESRRSEILSIPTDMATFKTNLGENYVEAENNGYPILAWQNEYVEF